LEDLVKKNMDIINAKLHTRYTSFTIDDVNTHAVAGTNHFMHLTLDGKKKVSATFFVPLSSSIKAG
jgi:hypothetical protein